MKNRWMNSWQISAFAWVLKAHAVNITMDGKRRAMDNIMVKQLWRAVKYEEIYLKEYLRVSQLTEGVRNILCSTVNNALIRDWEITHRRKFIGAV